MNVLNKMADLMWLNILTLICCIPVITAGAALTSMHYVALKIVRNEESYITRSFFKSFKTNFRQATLIWLLLMLVAAILGGDYYIITKSGMQFSQVLVVLIMAAGVLDKHDTELNQWINHEKEVLAEIAKQYGIEWEQKGIDLHFFICISGTCQI